MKIILVVLTLYISIIPMLTLSSAQLLDIKTSNSCLDYYTFENDSLTPKFAQNDGWQRSDINPHTGKKSFMSQLSARRISELSMTVHGKKYISFWWYSNKRRDEKNNSRLLFRENNEPNFIEYNSIGWNKVNYTSGEKSNTLTWIFYAGSNDSTSYIDDLCIQNLSCESECPEDSTNLSLITSFTSPEPPQLEPPVNVTITKNVTLSERLSNITQAANVTLPEPPQHEPLVNVTITENVTLPERLSNLTQAANVTPQVYYVINGCDQPPYIFPTIQRAINTVPLGSTINIINNGNEYRGGIIVNKTINLVGNNATIRTDNSNIGCYIVSNDAAISRVKFLGGRYGVWIEDASGCSIGNNEFDGCNIGILLDNAENSKITNNILIGSLREAIRLLVSINNTIDGNNITDANNYGIYMDRSNINNIIENMFENTYAKGVFLNKSDENIFRENIFTGQCLCDIFEYNSNNNNILNMRRSVSRCGNPPERCICHNA